jgi:hypothetical protein
LGRQREYTLPRKEWKKRVNPAFAKYWAAYKAIHLASGIANEGEKEVAFHQAFEDFRVAGYLLNEERLKIRDPIGAQLSKAISAPLDGEGKFEDTTTGMGYAINPESTSLFRRLVFLKHGITFRNLVMEIQTNRSAFRKLSHVHRDYHRFLSGQVPLLGLKLKFHWYHFDIILGGLDFGLSRLNPTELAAFLNAICPCAKAHSEEYSKKLRTKIQKMCKTIATNPDRTSWVAS